VRRWRLREDSVTEAPKGLLMTETRETADADKVGRDETAALIAQSPDVVAVLEAFQQVQPYLPNPMLAPQPQSYFSTGANATP
jgi:hypothetical protein